MGPRQPALSAPEEVSRLHAFISPLVERESEVHGFTPGEVKALMGGIYARGDRLMLRFLLAHGAVAIALAFFFHTWKMTLITSAIAVGMFAVSARLHPKAFLTRCVAGVSVQTFVALHIYQLHGLAEMHFFFFTGFTMMLVYQDGLSMWPGAWLIIGQHIVFAILHNMGYPLHFFEVQQVTVTRLFFHFGIALVQVGICAYWSVLLRRQTLRDAWQKARLHETGAQLTQQLDTIVASERALRASTQALSESLRRQREILDNIPDLAWLKDRDGRYVAVNATFTQTFSIREEDAVGRTDADFFPASLATRLGEHDAEVQGSGQQLRFEDKYLDRVGQWRDIDTIIRPIVDATGVLVGTMGIARDITERMRTDEERRRLEERMQRSQRMESLGVLAGGIAHDFNNLLVGVMGNAELARDVAGTPSEVKEALTDIETAARRAAELTRQLLAYAGRGQFVVEQMNLSTLVRETAALLRAAVSRKAELTLDLAQGLPNVEVDATQVRQVVMNLITNASEALGDNAGTITLRTWSLELDRDLLAVFRGSEDLRPGSCVAVSVTDTGAGIPEASLERVFDPFFTTKFTGRGLGLAAVLGIVRAHEAGIRVESREGKGTTFTLVFPASRATSDSVMTSRRSPLPPLPGSRVLIVDDDPFVRAATSRILERAGLEVLVANDGVDGLAMLEANEDSIRAVVLDVLMPRKDGVEVLREMARRWPQVRVVMTSGFTEGDVTERLRGLPYAGFLRKPYPIDELLALLHRALDDNSLGSAGPKSALATSSGSQGRVQAG